MVECLKGIQALGQALVLCMPGVVTHRKLSDQEFKVMFNQYIASFTSVWDRGVFVSEEKQKRRKGRKN